MNLVVWFDISKMIVNFDQLQAIIIYKKVRPKKLASIKSYKNIKAVSLLEKGDKLNFNLFISNICKSAAN